MSASGQGACELSATEWVWRRIEKSAHRLDTPARLTLLAVARHLDLACAQAGGDRFHASVQWVALVGVSHHDVAADIGVTPATARRYLRDLVERNLLAGANDRTYTLPRAAWPLTGGRELPPTASEPVAGTFHP